MTDLAARKGITTPRLGHDTVKGVMDIGLSSMLLVIASPVLLLLWCLVRSTSAGPGAFPAGTDRP